MFDISTSDHLEKLYHVGILKKSSEFSGFEVKDLHLDSLKRHFMVISLASQYGSENKSGVITMVIDTTLRHAIDEEMQSFSDKLLKLNLSLEREIKEKEEVQKQILHSTKLASIGELAAGMTHEINNPLAIIHGYTQILRDKLKNYYPEATDTLDKMEKAIERIGKIVNGLRTYAHVDSENEEVFNLIEVINETIQLIDLIFQKSGIKVKCSFKSGQAFLKGNIGKFQQTIMNLLTNARDAIEPKQGTITVETDEVDGQILIKVSDNGRGIPDDKIPRIFEAFYTTKDVGQGTGLGMAITNSIIESMNGTISVESKVGIGTTIILKLPKVN